MKTLLILLLSLALIPASANADDHSRKYGGENRGKPLLPARVNATWQQECGSCHLAFPPGLLPAASWRKIMANLDAHFNSDAGLTDAENREITDFLVNNASNRWTSNSSPLRISDSRWFTRKHGRGEISPDVWKRKSVKTPANCQACHQQADRGDFNERAIRIPN